MRNRFLTFLFASVFLFMLFSCETEPPNSVTGATGEVKISSSLDNEIDTISVFIDEQNSGYYSPATITLEEGEHSVYLKYDTVETERKTVNVRANETTEIYFTFAANNRKKVLLEDFANVSCDPCVISSEIIRNLLSGRYSDGSLVVLRYATNFPSPNDPFYLVNPEMFDARISFYNVLFAPTTIVDGTGKPISTDSNDIIISIEEALNAETEFTLSVVSEISGGNVNVSVTLDYPGGTALDNLALFTVLAKKEVSFNEPPGSNGETEFYDVAVAMLPTPNGEDLSGTTRKTFEYSVPNSYGLTSENLMTVVFIQNKLTKQIVQTNIN